jgi:hypothetical protein
MKKVNTGKDFIVRTKWIYLINAIIMDVGEKGKNE